MNIEEYIEKTPSILPLDRITLMRMYKSSNMLKEEWDTFISVNYFGEEPLMEKNSKKSVEKIKVTKQQDADN